MEKDLIKVHEDILLFNAKRGRFLGNEVFQAFLLIIENSSELIYG